MAVAYKTWNFPLIATPPEHCSAIAARVIFGKDASYAVPEGAILIATEEKQHDPAFDLMSTRAFGSREKGKSSILSMTPFYNDSLPVTQSSEVPLVAGVASDAIAPSSRHKANAVVSSAYIHGACNARCDAEDSQNFTAGDLVYIVGDADGQELYAASESLIQTRINKNALCVVGVLGTCLENGDRHSPFVRVFVDNMFNTMMSCC